MDITYFASGRRISIASPLRQFWLRCQQIGQGIGAQRYSPVAELDEFNEYEMYDFPGWDGYGADPIARETVQAARHFKRLLPTNAPQPDVAPGGDGTIGFEWRSGSPANRSLILVDVGPGSLITARRVDNASRIEKFQRTRIDTGARALIADLFS